MLNPARCISFLYPVSKPVVEAYKYSYCNSPLDKHGPRTEYLQRIPPRIGIPADGLPYPPSEYYGKHQGEQLDAYRPPSANIHIAPLVVYFLHPCLFHTVFHNSDGNQQTAYQQCYPPDPVLVIQEIQAVS